MVTAAITRPIASASKIGYNPSMTPTYFIAQFLFHIHLHHEVVTALDRSAMSELESDGKRSPGRRALVWGWVKKAANFVLAQYLIIGFGVACVLGYYFPCKPWNLPSMHPLVGAVFNQTRLN